MLKTEYITIYPLTAASTHPELQWLKVNERIEYKILLEYFHIQDSLHFSTCVSP